MAPQIYLILALAAALPCTYGAMWMKQQIVAKHAYEAGIKVGEQTVAAAVTAKASEIVTAEARGEAEAPAVPPEKVALQQLCNRMASCRDRKR
jgi:hypothetical protein